MFELLAVPACLTGAALVCFGIYGGLRWLSQVSPVAFYLLGVLGLLAHLLVVFVVGYLCLMPFNFDLHGGGAMPPPPPSSPEWKLFLGLLAGWGLPLSAGAALVRLGAREKMTCWGSILFCALYWAGSLAAIIYVGNHFGWSDAMGKGWQISGQLLGVTGERWLDNLPAVAGYLSWTFPLGAPICELAVANVRRLSGANRSGSFA